MVFDMTIFPNPFGQWQKSTCRRSVCLVARWLGCVGEGFERSRSAKGIVVTNAPHGANGSVSLIDASTNTITGTIPVGRNPKQVSVYYAGLVASDNQATPTW